MTTDAELLRRYAESDAQEAFTELVKRHVNVVYSAALRQVHGDAHLAQDVAQTVFTDLARKAAELSRRTVLTGWLYTSTHYAAAKAVRSESRRHTHEQEAHVMGQLINDPTPTLDWDKLRPLIDAAMHELREADREAILLRYFENRPLADVGSRLGLSENAARMRVDRALQKLRMVLNRRGVVTASAALSSVISTQAVQIAPAALATTLAGAAMAGAAAGAGAGTTLTLIKLLTMNKLATGIIGALVIASVATPLLMGHQSTTGQAPPAAMTTPADRIAQLEAENARLAALLAQATNQSGLTSAQFTELIKLRGEVGALRETAREAAKLKADPNGLADRVAKLKQKLSDMPGLSIPELQYLTDSEWQRAVQFQKLETDDSVRMALSQARVIAKSLFAAWTGQALHNYADQNGGMIPTDLGQLKPYYTPPIKDADGKPFDPPHYQLFAVDDSVLDRYKLTQSGKLADVPVAPSPFPMSNRGAGASFATSFNTNGPGVPSATSSSFGRPSVPWTEPIVAEKAPVDQDHDSLFNIELYGYSYTAVGKNGGGGMSTFARMGTNGVPILIDPPPAVGRVGGALMGGGGFGSFGGGGAGVGGGGFGGGGGGGGGG